VPFDIRRTCRRGKGSTGVYVKEPSVRYHNKMATMSSLSVAPSLATLSESASEGLASILGSSDSFIGNLLPTSVTTNSLFSGLDSVDFVDFVVEVFLPALEGMIAT
jgi:hypothetical protein